MFKIVLLFVTPYCKKQQFTQCYSTIQNIRHACRKLNSLILHIALQKSSHVVQHTQSQFYTLPYQFEGSTDWYPLFPTDSTCRVYYSSFPPIFVRDGEIVKRIKRTKLCRFPSNLFNYPNKTLQYWWDCEAHETIEEIPINLEQWKFVLRRQWGSRNSF